MMLGGKSDPRNKVILKMFNLLDIGERSGSGVPNIFNVWADQGWTAPMIEEEYNPDRTILTLSFTKTSEQNKRIKQANKTSEQNKRIKQSDKTSRHKQTILAYLKKTKTAGAREISAQLDLSDARTRAILKEMTDDGIIIADGKTNMRLYRIK